MFIYHYHNTVSNRYSPGCRGEEPAVKEYADFLGSQPPYDALTADQKQAVEQRIAERHARMQRGETAERRRQ